MKTVIQRVLKASASVDGEVIASIKKGLCILVGITKDDKKEDMKYIVNKILNTRFFEDGEGKRWSCSVKDLDLEILLLSQVTLYHKFKGNKLDFHQAMPPSESISLFEEMLSELKQNYKSDRVQAGKFGAYSIIDISNDGPVTVVVESPVSKSSV